jgi:hypothetical protein
MEDPAMFGSFFRLRSLGVAVLWMTPLSLGISVASVNASPSPAPTKGAATPVFVGPPGWIHVQGSSDGLGTWQGPGNADFYQTVVAQEKGGFASLDAFLQAEAGYISSLPDVFGYAPTDTTLCRNQPAKYLSYTYSSASGLPVTVETIVAVFGTTAYSARYSKSISQYADTSAERSLATLCGRAAK